MVMLFSESAGDNNNHLERHERMQLQEISPSARGAWPLIALTVVSFLLPTGAVGAETADNARVDLAEVTVTARRVDETITSVPISITALDSNTLDRENVQSFDDYITRIPNLAVAYGGSGYGFGITRITTIRGIVGANTTSYYLDDTPVPSSISPEVADLERIEVLKGPQGTLFGESSMGGNVRFISRTPSLSTDELKVLSEVGHTSRGDAPNYLAQVAANKVLVDDRVAIHGVVRYDSQAGYITRTYPDDVTQQRVSVNGQAADDTLSGALDVLVKVTDELNMDFKVLGQQDYLHGLPAAYAPLPDFRVNSYILDRARNVQEHEKDHWGIAAFTLHYNTPLANVTSSTSVFDRYTNEQQDGTEGTNNFIRRIYGVDFNNYPLAWQGQYRDKRITHESRVSLNALPVPGLTGIFGIYYQHDNAFDGSGPPLFLPGLQASGLWPNDLLWATSGHEVRTNSAAVFGEVYYEILPKLTVTVGARKYWLRQTQLPRSLDGFAEGSLLVVPELVAKQSGAVPKYVLSYKIGEQGNVYASASKGFRIGSAQDGVGSICNDELQSQGYTLEDTRQYKSDSLWSYEVGAKSAFGGGRLTASVAAFQEDWNGIQQQVNLNCGYNFITNAGRARIRGGELEFSGRPLSTVPLTLRGGVGYLSPVLTEPGPLDQAPNSRLYNIPLTTATVGGFYQAKLSEGFDGFIETDYSYTGSEYSTNVQPARPRLREAVGLLNAQLGVSFGHHRVALFGKNLTNVRRNFGDVRPISYEQTILAPDGHRIANLPEVAVTVPITVGLQYQWQW
jgi:iron complex outermembrane recepter protein